MIEIHDIAEVLLHLEGIRAVIFDLDDTLYAEKEYCRSGFTAIGTMYPEYPGLSDELWAAFCDGGKPIDTVLARHGLSDDRDRAVHTFRYHTPDIHLFPGVKTVTDTLRQKQIRTGIITDGEPIRQEGKLRALGIRHGDSFHPQSDEKTEVDEIIVTDSLGGPAFRKPCDLAFRRMSETLQIPFSEMIYVGDNPRKDFIAPEALGMRAVHFIYPDGVYYTRPTLFAKA